jgi:O-antigen/teichoic acid export membrane protein
MADSRFGARESTKQAKVVAATKISSAILAFVVQLAIARALPIADYATFSLFLAASSILTLLTLCGLDRVAFRLLPRLLLTDRRREGLIFVLGSTCLRVVLVLLTVLVFFVGALEALPAALSHQLSDVMLPLAVFFLASSLSDSASIYCNGLARHSLQGKVVLIAGGLRSTAVLAALASTAYSQLSYILKIYIVSEFFLAGVLFGVLIFSVYRPSAGESERNLDYGVTLGAVVMEATTTQLSYVLRMPFTGPFLRLLVGSFASPLVTAAFGFFQAIADRLYQFMPTVLLKGVLEPALVADYAVNADLKRLSTTLSLLVKLSLVGVSIAGSVLLALGEPLVNALTSGKYGSEYLLAIPICLQLMAQLCGESLWAGFNSIGRVRVINLVWAVSVCISGALMTLAVELRSVYCLILLSGLPYLLMASWLRWGAKERLLVGIGGFRFSGSVSAAFCISVVGAWLVVSWMGSSLFSLVLGCVVVLFLQILIFALWPPLTYAEGKAVRTVAPKVGSWLRLVSAKS